MFEKVNPAHPDKIADRIAGALVDYAYTIESNPKIAVEVLIGHGHCFIITESSIKIPQSFVVKTVFRIAGGNIVVHYLPNKQDSILASNQSKFICCGDNGIFKGVPLNTEEKDLTEFVTKFYKIYDTDGKFILDDEAKKLYICQSHMDIDNFQYRGDPYEFIINPLGRWTGGINVDSGATNRKLGSDMGRSITGGGLHGKDLSKADVSVNIYAWLKAQETNKEINLSCAIGDKYVDYKPYEEIVEIAREYINNIGGFEKFAEWGLLR